MERISKDPPTLRCSVLTIVTLPNRTIDERVSDFSPGPSRWSRDNALPRSSAPKLLGTRTRSSSLTCQQNHSAAQPQRRQHTGCTRDQATLLPVRRKNSKTKVPCAQQQAIALAARRCPLSVAGRESTKHRCHRSHQTGGQGLGDRATGPGPSARVRFSYAGKT